MAVRCLLWNAAHRRDHLAVVRSLGRSFRGRAGHDAWVARCGVSLLACAFAPNWGTFAPALVTTGIATPFILYNTAFAVLVQIDPQAAPRRITLLTLIAGFSSTLFWPLATALLQ